MLKQHKVERAYAFGSLCTDQFDDNSDIDLLISFNEGLNPVDQGEQWWDLYDSLKDYLHREMDLVTEKSLHNPYFIRELNQTKQMMYGRE